MVLICYGTRPEIIKLSPVINACRKENLPFKTLFTGQHLNLFNDVKDLIPKPDFFIQPAEKTPNLNFIVGSILLRFDEIFSNLTWKMVLVQGDTATVLACALAAFNNRIPVGHIEAGLRTGDLGSPFPEEGYRQMVSRIATLNFAPTTTAAQNLANEGINNNVVVTGNTIVDACMSFQYPIFHGRHVLITMHRRENFGIKMSGILEQLEDLAGNHPELDFIFPMHPNPEVHKHRHLLQKVRVIDPLNYHDFIKLLCSARFVISDSGGIQEECATFQKKVLVCRDKTERHEGVDSGFARLTGDNIRDHFDWANRDPEWSGINPYGDGHAAERIIKTIKEYLGNEPCDQ